MKFKRELFVNLTRLLGKTLIVFALAPAAGRAQDAIALPDAVIVNAPDVRSWPRTATITRLTFAGGTTRVDFTRKDGPGRWPDVTPEGWDGPLQYTLWLFVKNGDQWVGSAFIQFWHSREASGSAADPDVPSRYHVNWYYAERWRPIHGHGPIQPGEPIGFMVSSGNARDSSGPMGPNERSNVVVIGATDNGDFAFAPVVPPPVVIVPPAPPIVSPPPATVPPTAPIVPVPGQGPIATDVAILIAQEAANQAALLVQLELLKQQVAATRQDVAEFRAAVRSKWAAIVGSPIFKYGMTALAGVIASWGVQNMTRSSAPAAAAP